MMFGHARGLLVFIRTDGQCVSSVYVFVSALFIVPNSRTVIILWQTIIDNSGCRPWIRLSDEAKTVSGNQTDGQTTALC